MTFRHPAPCASTPRALAQHALSTGQAAALTGDMVEAARWFDRACRIAPNDRGLQRLRDDARGPTGYVEPVTVAPSSAPDRGAGVLLISHALGGGVERHVTERAAALRRDGWRVLILRPDRTRAGRVVLSLQASRLGEPALTPTATEFDFPDEAGALYQALADQRLDHIQFHHLLGHSLLLREIPERLDVAFDVVIHDYALICPRLNLIGANGIYCGEPLNDADCDACVATCGSLLAEVMTVGELRRQSAAWLTKARHVVVPSVDVARRLRRYYQDLAVEVVPWQQDCARTQAPAIPTPSLRACLVGALDQDKGLGILLSCAQDAAVRSLDLEFVVVGHTEDDMALFNTGKVFITGRYDEADGLALLRDQRGGVGFLPSLGPETWSYALTMLWEAGLAVAAFDLGAQAERITKRGDGLLLVPGLPAPRINDALMAFHSKAGQHSHD